MSATLMALVPMATARSVTLFIGRAAWQAENFAAIVETVTAAHIPDPDAGTTTRS